MITLTNGDQVRLAAWEHASVPVTTVRGYAAEYKENPETTYQRAVERGHNTAWTTFTGHMLYGNAEEGRRALAERRAKYDKAVVVEDGEQVEIEGEIFTVKVLPRNEKAPYNSDPIHFVKYIVVPPATEEVK